MVLQNSLRTVQLGQDKSADAPSVRLLSLVVGFSAVSAIIWVVVAIVCADTFNNVAKKLQQTSTTIEGTDFFSFFFGTKVIPKVGFKNI